MQCIPDIVNARLDWGVANRPRPGEAASGDMHIVKPFEGGVLLAAADGLGHGAEAVVAAQTAAAVLEEDPGAELETLVRRCHVALLRTRGAVITLASLRWSDSRLTWLGVGNVEAVLLRANPPARMRVVLRNGIVGYRLPELRVTALPMAPDDLLVFATDGLKNGFSEGLPHNASLQQIADGILERHFKGTDDALVLVLRYVSASH
jgi:hypothetical protein